MRTVRIIDRLKEINPRRMLVHNLWLKLISLGIAIVTWFYVTNEISKITQGIPT